ncbi:hypothetical protein DKX38_014493 [Salix brachista]|uniref:Auxin-responsive protein n=1 Tax=Salix brachista TaxID=2182728 RepID=A0A5N5LFK9_9ROSI|nr:hypothetical protein DKX38_014493 [Salix brachista]
MTVGQSHVNLIIVFSPAALADCVTSGQSSCEMYKAMKRFLATAFFFYTQEQEIRHACRKDCSNTHPNKMMTIRLPRLLQVKQNILRGSSAAKDVRKGYVAVYVGEEEKKRFVIPVSYLNQPSFQKLLSKAEEEFGFQHPMGGLTIPCREDIFIDLTSSLKAYVFSSHFNPYSVPNDLYSSTIYETTELSTRDKFYGISVEIDLTKPSNFLSYASGGYGDWNVKGSSGSTQKARGSRYDVILTESWDPNQIEIPESVASTEISGNKFPTPIINGDPSGPVPQARLTLWVQKMKYQFDTKFLVPYQVEVFNADTILELISADKVSHSLGFRNSFRVEAQGFLGGLWILWKDSSVRVREVDGVDQFVHNEIDNSFISRWICTVNMPILKDILIVFMPQRMILQIRLDSSDLDSLSYMVDREEILLDLFDISPRRWLQDVVGDSVAQFVQNIFQGKEFCFSRIYFTVLPSPN